MGVEQHLMGLLRIGAQDEGAAAGELDVGDLQLGPFTADDRPVLRPVELESLPRLERQGHVGAAVAGLLLPQPGGLPLARERRHAVVGAFIPDSDRAGAFVDAGDPKLISDRDCPIFTYLAELCFVPEIRTWPSSINV